MSRYGLILRTLLAWILHPVMEMYRIKLYWCSMVLIQSQTLSVKSHFCVWFREVIPSIRHSQVTRLPGSVTSFSNTYSTYLSFCPYRTLAILTWRWLWNLHTNMAWTWPPDQTLNIFPAMWAMMYVSDWSNSFVTHCWWMIYLFSSSIRACANIFAR